MGLPESPVKDVVLRNVKIGAQTGLTIGYADRDLARHVEIDAGRGPEAIDKDERGRSVGEMKGRPSG